MSEHRLFHMLEIDPVARECIEKIDPVGDLEQLNRDKWDPGGVLYRRQVCQQDRDRIHMEFSMILVW